MWFEMKDRDKTVICLSEVLQFEAVRLSMNDTPTIRVLYRGRVGDERFNYKDETARNVAYKALQAALIALWKPMTAEVK